MCWTKEPIWEHKGGVSCAFTECFPLSLLFRELSGPTVDHWVNLVDPNWWWLNNLAILRVTFQQKGGYVNPFWISKLEHFTKWIRWKLEITNYIPSVTFYVKIIVTKTNKQRPMLLFFRNTSCLVTHMSEANLHSTSEWLVVLDMSLLIPWSSTEGGCGHFQLRAALQVKACVLCLITYHSSPPAFQDQKTRLMSFWPQHV